MIMTLSYFIWVQKYIIVRHDMGAMKTTVKMHKTNSDVMDETT